MPPRGSKKPPGTAVDKRNGQRFEIAPSTPALPEPPPGLRPDVLEIWDNYWADPVAAVARTCDLAIVRRWITNTNRYLTLLDAADAEPVVKGSMGQDRPNGLYELGLKLEASIRVDEKQLGLGPKSRAGLGIAVISERKSLAELNQAYSQPGRTEALASGNDDDDTDPRLKAV